MNRFAQLWLSRFIPVTPMAEMIIAPSQLFEICHRACSSLPRVKEQAPDSACFSADGLVTGVIEIMRFAAGTHHLINPQAPIQNNSSIGFSYFAAYLITKITSELGRGFDVRTALHKESALAGSFRSDIKYYLEKTGQTLVEEELLVDFFITPSGKKHCPLLTAESESRENGKYEDLSKLLLVTSPRRLYIAQITSSFQDAAKVIADILDEAYASGAINTGDQIAFVLYKQHGQQATFQLYEADQYRHL